MKKVLSHSLLVLLISSCSLFVGDDGQDGLPYLAIDWIERPAFYQDSNPSIPDNYKRGHFYETQTGTYSFEYAYEDGFGWEGHYVIKEAEPGESGSFFRSDGGDGKDNYYTLLLSYHGSSFDNEYRKSVLPSVQEYEVLFGRYVFKIVKQRIYPDASD